MNATLLKVVLWAALVGVLGYAGWRTHDYIWQSGYATRDAEAKVALAAAVAEAVEAERALRIKKENALERKIRALQIREETATAGVAASNRLLDASGASLAQAATGLQACLVSAATHANVFAQCESRYRSVAKAADGHVADLNAQIGASNE